MSNADQIWDELDGIYLKWGLNEIPFSESPSILRPLHLHQVFTGRVRELRDVISLFRGNDRKRILVYGWVGIGKTAFIMEILNTLRRKSRDTLTAYISLPAETDLPTAALVALAREMEDDVMAQHQLSQMGLRSRRPVPHRGDDLESTTSLTESNIEESRISFVPPRFPAINFDDLLERALKKYRRVVIAIDDLDKQDPAYARQLLHDAQGILKSGAWFMITGHPSGLTRDLLISERGLFDFSLKLEEMDLATTYLMLVNYLNSVRPEDARLNPHDPKAVHPFTPETARELCERAGGVPRWLNRLGSYILLKAAELHADIITPDVLQLGFAYTDQQLRGQVGLSPEDYYVLDLVLERGMLSDVTVTLTDLERFRAKEFSEILPVLERLIQLDLIRRLPTERASEYVATPMLLGKKESSEQKDELDRSNRRSVGVVNDPKGFVQGDNAQVTMIFGEKPPEKE
jgi:hypothetical protein